MQRDTRRERGWPTRDQDVEIWGRHIGRDEWQRGTYGSPDYDRGRWPGRGPAWDRGDQYSGEYASEWDRVDRPGWDRQDREGWQRSPNYEWQGDQRETWTRRVGHTHWHGRTTMRDFTRSDERIREEVCSRMCEHPAIDTSEMRVLVEGGEVTLEGWVDDRYEKRLAEDLAETVPGVKDIHNRLRTNGHRADEPKPHHPVEGVADS